MNVGKPDNNDTNIENTVNLNPFVLHMTTVWVARLGYLKEYTDIKFYSKEGKNDFIRNFINVYNALEEMTLEYFPNYYHSGEELKKINSTDEGFELKKMKGK